MKAKNTQKLCQLLLNEPIDLVKVSKLIYKEADVNAILKLDSLDAQHPLIFVAVWYNNAELLALLLNNGADIDKLNSAGDDIFKFHDELTTMDKNSDYHSCAQILEDRKDANFNEESHNGDDEDYVSSEEEIYYDDLGRDDSSGALIGDNHYSASDVD